MAQSNYLYIVNLYLNNHSHHPLHQKLGVIKTLFDRKDNIVTENQDKVAEEQNVEEALKVCGYPEWTFEKVKGQMHVVKPKKKRRKDIGQNKGMVVLPYVKGVTERISRVLKSYDVAAACSPHNTIRNELAHPKDKCDQLNTTHAIYEALCRNCDLVYIGETGRKFALVLRNINQKWRKLATRWQRGLAGKSHLRTLTYQRSLIMWQIKIVLLVGNRLKS